MTRIIAGFAGSLELSVPRSGTRPTSDRVREAIFSALQARDLLDGARVVDLYAGTGALGLEAASRGAASVDLVENNPRAVAACRVNALAVSRNAPRNLAPAITVASEAVQHYLTNAQATWDIAFLDPPYELGDDQITIDLTLLGPRLAADGIVVIERASRDGEPPWGDDVERDRSTRYGDTTVWWGRVTASGEAR